MLAGDLRATVRLLQALVPGYRPSAGLLAGVAGDRALPAPEAAIAFVINEVAHTRGMVLAGFQPGFIVEQVLAACRFQGAPPRIDEALLLAAIDNLDTRGA